MGIHGARNQDRNLRESIETVLSGSDLLGSSLPIQDFPDALTVHLSGRPFREVHKSVNHVPPGWMRATPKIYNGLNDFDFEVSYD